MPGQGPVPCPSEVAGADVISTHRADVIIKCADVNSHWRRRCQHQMFLKGRLVIVNTLQAKTTGRQQTVWGDTIRATTQHNNSYSSELAKRCIELGTFFGNISLFWVI